jgi:hypothetical protein
MEDAEGHRLADQIAEAARAQDGQHEPYLARIRRATARLGPYNVAPDDLRGALLAVEDHARIDLNVPTSSSRKTAAMSKVAVKRLIGWYLRYVGDQTTLLGHAMVRLGSGLVEHTERLEETTGTLAADVAALSARVDRLEQGPGGRRGSTRSSPRSPLTTPSETTSCRLAPPSARQASNRISGPRTSRQLCSTKPVTSRPTRWRGPHLRM